VDDGDAQPKERPEEDDDELIQGSPGLMMMQSAQPPLRSNGTTILPLTKASFDDGNQVQHASDSCQSSGRNLNFVVCHVE
jgi:hypothetical protein